MAGEQKQPPKSCNGLWFVQKQNSHKNSGCTSAQPHSQNTSGEPFTGRAYGRKREPDTDLLLPCWLSLGEVTVVSLCWETKVTDTPTNHINDDTSGVKPGAHKGKHEQALYRRRVRLMGFHSSSLNKQHEFYLNRFNPLCSFYENCSIEALVQMYVLFLFIG